MYKWGYLKQAALAKLDLDHDEVEADTQNLINRFGYYANEAMTQICSAVKPKYTFYEVRVENIDSTNEGVIKVDDTVRMPEDFISFGDDVNTISYFDPYGIFVLREAHDDDFVYIGNNHVIFKKPGKYRISYNARWIDNFDNLDDNAELDVPKDILDCIPSYIASQCYKVDDEYKASAFRNEYEIFLSRIDDTNYKNTKTFTIEGDW